MHDIDDLANAGNKVVGIKQLLRGLEDDAVACVYIADDAEEDFKSKIFAAVDGMEVDVCSVDSMDLLGNVCGIHVGAACAAILKD